MIMFNKPDVDKGFPWMIWHNGTALRCESIRMEHPVKTETKKIIFQDRYIDAWISAYLEDGNPYEDES